MRHQIIDVFIEKLMAINQGQKLRARGVLKVGELAKEYLLKCWQRGETVNILSQCCVTKYLEERRHKQGGQLKPLKNEVKLFMNDIPIILKLFKDHGFIGINWVFAFIESENIRRRTSTEIKKEFIELYQSLVGDLPDLLLCDWQDDVLGKKQIIPSLKVLNNFTEVIKVGAYQFEYQRRLQREVIDLGEDRVDYLSLGKETKKRIAEMASEALVITQELYPEGLIIVPTEEVERFVFFNTLVPNFKELLVYAIKPNFWRMKED